MTDSVTQWIIPIPKVRVAFLRFLWQFTDWAFVLLIMINISYVKPIHNLIIDAVKGIGAWIGWKEKNENYTCIIAYIHVRWILCEQTWYLWHLRDERSMGEMIIRLWQNSMIIPMTEPFVWSYISPTGDKEVGCTWKPPTLPNYVVWCMVPENLPPFPRMRRTNEWYDVWMIGKIFGLGRFPWKKGEEKPCLLLLWLFYFILA